MPRCTAITATESQCTRNALEEGTLCRLHQTIVDRREEAAGPIHEGRCSAILSGKPPRRCHKPVHADGHCRLHETIHARHHARELQLRAAIAEAQRQDELLLQEVIVRYTAMVNGGDPWQTIVNRIETDRHQFILRWAHYRVVFDHLAGLHPGGYAALARLRWEWNEQELLNRPIGFLFVGAGAGPVPLHQDHQSVHRAEVSEQTNRGTEILLKVPVPAGQNTIRMLLSVWGGYGWVSPQQFASTYLDVTQWYNQSYCRALGDYYYRSLLDHAVALAESSPHKDDLYKRLYEEATDATKMCCEGHISRIVNAFVGIVDGFESPMSNKELLQTRLAAIAATDKPIEEKQKDAREVLTELRVPEAEHAVWLEAF